MQRAEDRRGLLTAAAIVVSAAVLCYLGAIRGQFVYDDPILIAQNPLVAGEDVSLGDIFSQEYFGGGGGVSGYYRPLMVLLFRAEYALFGGEDGGAEAFAGAAGAGVDADGVGGGESAGSAVGYHAVNILFHAAAAVLLLLVMSRCGLPVAAAALGAILFAVHPVNSESVAWISGGGNPVVFTLMAVSLLLLLAFRRRLDDPAAPRPAQAWLSAELWLSFVVFVAALCVKEWALIQPFLVLLLLAAPAAPDARVRAAGGRLVFALPFLAAAAGFVVLHLAIAGAHQDPDLYYGHGSGFERALTFFSVLPRYVGLLVWPADLNLGRPVELVSSPWSPAVWAGFAVAVAAVLFVIHGLRGRRWTLVLGGALFLFPMLMVSTIVPIAYNFPEMDFPFFERYLYIPSAGVGCLAAAAAAAVLKREWARMPLFVGAAALFVVLGIATSARTRDWRDDLSLFARAVELYPESPRLAASLGVAELYAAEAERARGLYTDARASFEKARAHSRRAYELDSSFFDARVNEALAVLGLGRRSEAEGILDDVLDRSPRHPLALDTLGMMRVEAGELEAALPLFAAAYESSGRDPQIAGNLYTLTRDLKPRAEELYVDSRRGEAVDLAERVIAAAPAAWVAWAYELKGLVLLDQGDEAEAVEALVTAVNVSRDSLVAARRLANLFRERGLEAEALEIEAYIAEGKKRISPDALDEADGANGGGGGGDR